MTIEEIYIERLKPCLEEVENEILNAKDSYPNDFNSGHEGLAVLEEEFLELRDQIFWGLKKEQKKLENDLDKNYRKATAIVNHKTKIREEARQVAAMALRIMVELT